MIRKLRIKFICINMTIVTAMLAVIFSLLIVFVGVTAENQGRQAIQEITETALRAELHPERPRQIRRPYFLVRMDTNGRVLSIDCGYFQEVEENLLLEYTNAALETERDSGTLPEYRLRYQLLTNPFGKTLVFADISGEIAAMENLVTGSLVIAALSFAAFLAVSILLAHWAVRPVAEAWDRQQQFIADASHELKTPLTVIMTNAELLQSRTEKEDCGQITESILTMARQMRGLVESMLDLARLDNGTGSMAFSELDFSELVSESLLPFEPVYFERELLLENEITRDLRVKGSAAHLRQVLDILLDNGAKYAAAGTQVQVRLQRQGNGCLLSVASAGESISRDDLKHIFERFYRIDKARTQRSSYGLGLSIARSIVTEHGGKIWAESHGGINTFFIRIPLL